MARTAVVVFNLGGPDKPQSVRPFLFNLFNDGAIIGLPQPFRWALAQLISRRRAPVAQEIYQHLGGKSPLLELTEDQARALKDQLNAASDDQVEVFVCMRYWHPMSDEVAGRVKDYAPDRIILLPLYPQFSTTTSGSSLADWRRAAERAGIAAETHALCCYPTDPGWIAAQARLISNTLKAMEGTLAKSARVLFSAHGLPKKVIAKGDPYQTQVEQTAAAVVARMNGDESFAEIADWQVCYQSRVGPLEWIGPSTEAEIARAANDGVAIVVVPIAFVSEHSETLVELDIEYREEAEKLGVPGYFRVPAVGTAPEFINGLADIVMRGLGRGIGSGDGQKQDLTCGLGMGARICSDAHGCCPMAKYPMPETGPS